MSFTVNDLIAIAIMAGGMFLVRFYIGPTPTQKDNPPHGRPHLMQQDHRDPPPFDSVLSSFLGVCALLAGIGIGVITLSSVKKSASIDCYYVGELSLRTDCVNPLVFYYAPLGLALLLIILGVVGLVTRALKP